MNKKWHDGMHHIIINTGTGAWVQQEHTPHPGHVLSLNEHENRNGRPDCYIEKEFTTKEIQDKNKTIGR